MEYLPKTQEAILARHKAGMSLGKICHIYGGTVHNIEVLVEDERRNSRIATLQNKGDVIGFPTHLFEGFPEKIRAYAKEVAFFYNVSALTLFMDVGDKRAGILVRGCYFHGLNTRFDWSYRKIGRAHKRSSASVILSIKRYCESVGAIEPKEVRSGLLKELG